MNEVTQEGLPILFVKDIPPQSTVPGSIDVKEPSIYFGELTNNYVLVNTNAKEFHYSKAEGEENVETVYNGADGVRIGGLARRLLFSLGFQSLQILFSNDITADSRVLYHRNITDRVTTIAPFLRYDDDPVSRRIATTDGCSGFETRTRPRRDTPIPHRLRVASTTSATRSR